MWSPDPVDLERYLTMKETLSPGVVALRAIGGELLPARFPYFSEVAPIVQFVQVAGLELARLRQAYLDPGGRPLFKLWS